VDDAPREEVSLRRASAADAAGILALVPRLVAFGPPAWRDPGSMTEADHDAIADAIASATEDPAVYIAERDAVLAGFVHVHSQVDYYRRRPHGHVADLVVAPAFEGQGVAQRLIAEAERWARALAFDWLTISVFDENRRAAGLYEHLGFGRDIASLVKPLG
jgi:ribosomal protein S18 acetylase RimI-like enzyme